MTWDLQTLADRIRAQLAQDNTPDSRKRVAGLLASALADPAFVAAQFAANASERHVLHEDPDLGFCLVAHDYQGAKTSGPHDHGPSWAIYGQAAGETVMSDFEIAVPATATACAKVRRLRTYTMRQGDVHLYNEGDLHAPSRAGATRLLRVEGTNMARVVRTKFEAIET